MQESIEIFIIYAREDKALCQEIVTQLGAMKRQGLIKVWHDRNISPGKERKRYFCCQHSCHRQDML